MRRNDVQVATESVPPGALRGGDEVVAWLDDWTDVPLAITEADAVRVRAAAAVGAVPPGASVHLTAPRGVRLALAFEVVHRLPTAEPGVELLELRLVRALDLSARRHERRDEGGRAVRAAASLTDVRPAMPVRLLDRSSGGVRFTGPDTFSPGDEVVLRDGDAQIRAVVVRRAARPFGRAEYGCSLIPPDAAAATG